jgi:hypothetical protein
MNHRHNLILINILHLQYRTDATDRNVAPGRAKPANATEISPANA